jgi:hypothetical protein
MPGPYTFIVVLKRNRFDANHSPENGVMLNTETYISDIDLPQTMDSAQHNGILPIVQSGFSSLYTTFRKFPALPASGSWL